MIQCSLRALAENFTETDHGRPKPAAASCDSQLFSLPNCQRANTKSQSNLVSWHRCQRRLPPKRIHLALPARS